MIPYAPRERFTQPNRLSDLILRAGDARAESQMRGGQIWGNALQNVGKIASNAVMDYGEAKQEQVEKDKISKRDAGFYAEVQRMGGMPDLNTAVKYYGPKDAPVILKGYYDLQEAKAKPGNEARAKIPSIAAAYLKQSPGSRKFLYENELLPLAQKIGIPQEQLPKSWSPDVDGLISDFAKGYAPTEKPIEVSPGASLYDPTTKQTVFTAPPKPADMTPEESAIASYASKIGKKPEELSYDERLEARKGWAGADDRPRDPIAQELGLIRLNEEREKAAAASEGRKVIQQLPPEKRTTIERITNSMSKAKRDSWVATLTRAVEDGDEDELKSLTAQAAVEGENAETRKAVLGRAEMVAALKDAETVLKTLKAEGVPTGLLSGTAEDIARKLGTSTNPKYVSLANQLTQTLINYRKAATGAAFSDKESAQYKGMFPDYGNTFPVNEALIQGLIRAADTNNKTYWNQKIGKKQAEWLLGTGKPAAVKANPDGSNPNYKPPAIGGKPRLVLNDGVWERQ